MLKKDASISPFPRGLPARDSVLYQFSDACNISNARSTRTPAAPAIGDPSERSACNLKSAGDPFDRQTFNKLFIFIQARRMPSEKLKPYPKM
jgi:hypothetical protein